MKRANFLTATAVLVLISGTAAWQVAAQQQSSSGPDTLTKSQYPDGSGFGTQLATLSFPNLPFGGLQGKTHDSIEKVYAFYRDKATGGLSADHGFNWQNNTETTLLVDQAASGGTGFSAMGVSRQVSDNALLIAHQPTRTIIIKLSRDAQDRSETDISIVVDKR